MMLKPNAFIHINNKYKKAVLYDTYNGRKYYIPYEIGEKAMEDKLTGQAVKKINDSLVDEPVLSFDNDKINELDELRIILTNKCNFECIYCFADCGSYGMKIGDMTYATARKIIHYFSKRYKTVRQISFFGGEPLLCIDLIEYICKLSLNAWKGNSPDFSMVTNGSLLNERATDIIRKFNISIVVSLDGPQKINDMQRLMKNGDSAFDLVDRNLTVNCKDINFSIEATYTSNHVHNNMTRKDVRDYLADNYQTDRIIVNDVCIDAGDDRKSMEVAAEEISDDVRTFFSDENKCTDYVFHLTRTFLNGGYSRYFCKAGIKKYTVDMTGNIYPCHLFVGDLQAVICNVYGNEIKSSYRENLLRLTKECQTCSACGYKLFCTGCTCEILKGRDICSLNKNNVEFYLHSMLDLFMIDNNKYNSIIERNIAYGLRNSLQENDRL